MSKEIKALTHIEGVINKTVNTRLMERWAVIQAGLVAALEPIKTGELVRIPEWDYNTWWRYGFAAQTYTSHDWISPGINGQIKLSDAAILNYLQLCYWKENESKVRDEVIKEITDRLNLLPNK